MVYYESAAYGKVCEIAFGLDLKQQGMMTKSELDLLLDNTVFDKSQRVLEVGCGAGQVAAYISNQTNAKFMCIDVDDKAITWVSNACKNNKNLRFRVLDLRSASEIGEKFDKILSIDSLYFVSDMRADTFLSSLEATLKSLYALLEKNGELIVFYSELPFFTPEKKEPEYTQLGICLHKLGYSYKAFDLTDGETAFWRKFRDTLVQHKQDFILEGSKELFDSNVKEAEFILQGVEAGRTYRNLYMIQ